MTTNRGRLLIFQVETHDAVSEVDQVYALNKKYYRVSTHQAEANWRYVNNGFDTEIIPLTVKDWRVGSEDGHLNDRATDQVMTDLAERLRARIAQ